MTLEQLQEAAGKKNKKEPRELTPPRSSRFERLEEGCQLFSVVYFSTGTESPNQKRGKKGTAGDLATDSKLNSPPSGTSRGSGSPQAPGTFRRLPPFSRHVGWVKRRAMRPWVKNV